MLKYRAPVLTHKELDAINSALAFALAGEFKETFGDDCGFTREDVDRAQDKVIALMEHRLMTRRRA